MEIKPEFGGVQLKKATTTITAQEEPQNVNKIQDLAKVDKIDQAFDIDFGASRISKVVPSKWRIIMLRMYTNLYEKLHNANK